MAINIAQKQECGGTHEKNTCILYMFELLYFNVM